jgi:D-alanyl-D-alanine carboxypeptidase
MREIGRRMVIQAGIWGLGFGVSQAITEDAFALPRKPISPFAYRTAKNDIRDFALDHAKLNGLPSVIISLADRSGWQDQILVGSANLDHTRAIRPDHLFQIGSISKSITALCIFTLIADNALALATPIKEILPSLTIASAQPITVQHLLNHMSGLPGDTPLQYAFAEDGIVTKNRPGAHWNYSNLGYKLLGLVIEQVAQRSLANVLHDKIFVPLGMTATKSTILQKDRHLYATGYGPSYTDRPFPVQAEKSEAPWVNVTEATGSVASTSADMGRYLHYLLTMGVSGSQALLPPDLAEQFLAITAKAPGWEAGANFANGLAVIERDGRTFLTHTGGMIGFSSAMHVDREGSVAAFASTNVGHQSYRPNAITEFACRRLLAVKAQRAFALPAAAPKPRTADRLLGKYSNRRGGTISLLCNGDELLLTDGQAQIVFINDGKGYYIAANPSQTAEPILISLAESNPPRLWWGDIQYVKHGANFLIPSVQSAALAGRYENDDPWFGLMRIMVPDNRILLNGSTELIPAESGSFRLGDDPDSPERARFHGFAGNRPQFLDISGVTYTRRDFEPGETAPADN